MINVPIHKVESWCISIFCLCNMKLSAILAATSSRTYEGKPLTPISICSLQTSRDLTAPIFTLLIQEHLKRHELVMACNHTCVVA